jgi:tetratricopeptide (TPR) repeat protein
MVLCLLAARPARADVVTTHNGDRIDGLIVEADDESVLVRWGAGRAVITRRVPRKQIRSIQFTPPEVDALRDLARRSEAQGDTVDASQVFRLVCALQPESCDDHLALAKNLRACGRFAEAAAAAQVASRIDARNPRLYFEQGEIRLALGEGRTAAQLAADGLAVSGAPGVEGNWLLGRAFEQASLPDEAIAAYRKVLATEPGHLGALERLVPLCLEHRTALEVEDAARAFVKAAPGTRFGHTSLGAALYRQGRFAEAIEALRAATALGGPGYERARVYLHCARARSAGTDAADGLSADELVIAGDLDPQLRKVKP